MYLDASTYWLFVPAAIVVLLIPGPAVLYIITRSIDQGRAAGVTSALGCGLGNCVHVVAAALGLSALVASSALAFSLIKYAGGAYLIYIGIRRLHRRDETDVEAPKVHDRRRLFTEGVIVCALNPKTALFFLAFIPQFVDPSRGSVIGQVVTLGMTFVLLGIVTDSCYGLLVGTFGHALRTNERFLRAQRYVAGSLYIGLGMSSIVAGNGKK
jgi:threonine/homoserine/homoserine lactone efflux protein